MSNRTQFEQTFCVTIIQKDFCRSVYQQSLSNLKMASRWHWNVVPSYLRYFLLVSVKLNLCLLTKKRLKKLLSGKEGISFSHYSILRFSRFPRLLNYCVSLLWKNLKCTVNNQETMSMAIFHERRKSRFCIGPGKRPFTEINHVTVIITRNRKLNALIMQVQNLYE